jgi:hypothetical protein
MAEAATELGALGEAVVFLNHFRDLPDPRQAGKVLYPLEEILLLCLLAALAGAETFVDIARFGQKKLDLLRRFRPFRDGTPRMTTWATSSRRSTPRNSSAASSPGSRH